MAALKVLTFGWELAPVLTGGLGVVCRELTDALIEKDIKVTFVVPKFPNDININGISLINASNYPINTAQLLTVNTEAFIDPYGYYNEGVAVKLINGKIQFGNELYGIDLLQDVEKYALAAQEISKNIDCDVIHCHDWMTGVAALKAKSILNKPLIVHIHSTEYDRSANNPYPLILKYEQKILDGADHIIAISQYTKKIIVEKYHICPDKVSVVHNAIGKSKGSELTSDTASTDRIKNVLFLGRLTVQKGADYLLKAAKKVLDRKRNVRFVIVGNGPMLKKLVDMSFDLGISDSVIFAGSMGHGQVDEAYKQASLFVMPSVSEPFGITALESIKNGTPVLISKQSGASEVIKNGLKVDFWDIDAMASKIISVLNHEPLASTLKANGYRDLQKLTWSNQADKVIEIYQRLISEYSA